jgi:assimilatory nitrate reductase catalytic subunit
MSPTDLERLHIPVEGGLVKVESAEGSCVLHAVPDTRQRPGEIFIPMHWSDAFCSAGPADRLVNAAVDPISGQPELKATPVSVQYAATHWRALLLHRHAVRPEFAGYWSSVPVAKGFVFELAGTEALASNPAEFFHSVCKCPADAEILSVSDAKRGGWRFASLVNGRLESCLFITTRTDAALPAREGLAGLLNETIADDARAGLLAARTSKAAATGRTICACYSVGLLTLQRNILAHRFTTAAEIGLALSAGTNCGSCIPELNEILRDIHANAA